jgi:hypothetical protein
MIRLGGFLLACALAGCAGAGPQWRGGVTVTSGTPALPPGMDRHP